MIPNLSRIAKIMAVEYIIDMHTSLSARKKLAVLSLFGR